MLGASEIECSELRDKEIGHGKLCENHYDSDWWEIKWIEENWGREGEW